MDFAQLGLTVDSSQLARGNAALRTFQGEAARTEAAATRMGAAATRSFGIFRAAIVTSVVGGIAAASAAMIRGIKSASDFADAMAEVSTLVNTATFDMKALEKAALAQAAAFGSTPVQQTKAFYQAISAGAKDAAEAIEIVTAANKLAVGGVTDVFTATDGLTSVMNAYGDAVQGATAVSDALFVGMKAGKTTIGELAGSLGKVAPLAVTAGVSFDELVASVAALTKGGIATNEAVSGMRAILAAIVKPSAEAQKQAQQLGLEFSVAALRSKGLTAFLEDLVQKTGGSTDAMAQLFGGIEALNPVLALAGQAGVDFSAIMAAMAKKAGATQEAVDKMAASPGFQAKELWSALGNAATKVGLALSGPVASGFKAAAAAVNLLSDNADALIIAIALLASTQLPALIIALRTSVFWLGTIEAQFIAGAVAARAMAFAMRAIPIVAAAAAITGIVRDYQAQAEAARIAEENQRALNRALDDYSKTHSKAAAKSALDVAKAEAESARATLIAMETMVARAQAIGAIFTFDIQAKIDEQREKLAALQMTIGALARETPAAGGVVQDLSEDLGNLAGSADDAATAAYRAIPAYSDLVKTYGALANQVRDVLEAQNAIAADTLVEKVQALNGQTEKLVTSLRLSGEEAEGFRTIMANLGQEGSLAGMSQNLRATADLIRISAGGLENMNEGTKKVYAAMLDASVAAAEMAGQTEAAAGFTDRLAALASSAAASFFNLRDGGAGVAAAIYAARDAANALANALANAVAMLGRAGGAVTTVAKGAVELFATTTSTGRIASAVVGTLSNAVTGAATVANRFGTALLNAAENGLHVAKAVGGGGGGSGKSIKEALTEAEKRAIQFANAMKEKIGGAVDDIVGWMIDGFKGGFDSLFDILVSTIKQMIAFAIANPIKIALGLSPMSATASAAGTVAQAATGATGGTGILGSLLGGVSSFFGGVGTGLQAALGLGGFASAGIFNVAANAATAVATGVGGLAATLGAAIPIIGVVALGISALFKKTKVLDTGIRLTVNNFDTLVETFKKVKTSRLFGLISSTDTSYSKAAEAVAAPLIKAVADVQQTVLDAAKTLGVGKSAFEGFTAQIKISTKGLSDDEVAAKLEEKFKQISDGMADMVLAGTGLVKEGETATEALDRLATSLNAVNNAAQLLGNASMAASLANGELASYIIEGAGGLEAFNSAVESFFGGFYSASEQLTNKTEILREAFADLGLALPTSREEFRAIVEAVDKTTVGGAQLYGQLLALSGAFAEVTAAAGGLTQGASSILNGLLAQIDEMILRSTEAARVASDAAGAWDRAGSAIMDFITDFRSTTSELVSLQQANAFNLRRFKQLARAARSGDVEAASDLPDAARSLLQTSADLASNRFEAAKAQAMVLQKLQAAGTTANVEEARFRTIADLLTLQVDLLQQVRDGLTSGEAIDPEQLVAAMADVQSLYGLVDQMLKAPQRTLVDLEIDSTGAFGDWYASTTSRLLTAPMQALGEQIDGATTENEKANRALRHAALAVGGALRGSSRTLAGSLTGTAKSIMDTLNGTTTGLSETFAGTLGDLILAMKKSTADLVKAIGGASGTSIGDEVKRALDLRAAENTLTALQTKQDDIKAGIAATQAAIAEATKPVTVRKRDISQGTSQDDVQWIIREVKPKAPQELVDALAASRDALADLAAQVADTKAEIERLSSSVPAYASGGMHSGGLALVGEEGPELIRTGGPALVYSASQTASILKARMSGLIDRLFSSGESAPATARSGDKSRYDAGPDGGPVQSGRLGRVSTEKSKVDEVLTRILDEIAEGSDRDAKTDARILSYLKNMRDTFRKWDIDGLPAERA